MKPKSVNENITEGKKGECDMCAKGAEDISMALNEEVATVEYIKISGVSEKSIDLIEEIKRMSDEEFDMLLDRFDWRTDKRLFMFAKLAIKERM